MAVTRYLYTNQSGLKSALNSISLLIATQIYPSYIPPPPPRLLNKDLFSL